MEETGLPFKGPAVYTGGLSLVQQVSQRRGGRVTEPRGWRPLERPWGVGRGLLLSACDDSLAGFILDLDSVPVLP